MRSNSYFLKSGKGTYGEGHTQIAPKDIYVNHISYNDNTTIREGIKQKFNPTLGNFSNEYSVQNTRAFYSLIGDVLTFSISFNDINTLVQTPSQFIINLRLPYAAEVHTPLQIGRRTNIDADLRFAEILRGQTIIAFYDTSSKRISNVLIDNGELTLSGSFILGSLFS
ncbi:hypothetical protein J8281_14980 [Aquimarina sp. U1-2]|uniref:hypothetical protein n=1 Tax=Aquimarina sp. U1-2 TaxID=2823141 RepID=UPI001AED08CF|nr:hypothetical protein [Aquimarina sp. U1-2]MBP2833497.1 hypothetical protein [Aquimarina sp. U1-2]